MKTRNIQKGDRTRQKQTGNRQSVGGWW